jgi:poly-gamma-glutamate capsule biosynthesis protein CapA/YwtB (metallophosphatase superfamily)
VAEGAVTLFLAGDVMLGRGVDQILPYPGDPTLREPHVQDARTYVRLAEAENGPIPRPVDPAWPWGDALRLLEDAAPDVRVVNLETSITRRDEFAPDKAVHYRMNPANLRCLTVVRPDVCVLANNHMLDFGRGGLEDTLDTLAGAGLPAAGAGRDAGRARQPAVVDLDADRRVLVFSLGLPSSGIPLEWAASDDRSGVHVVPGPSTDQAAELIRCVRRMKGPRDVVVASIHWGSNWGYHLDPGQTHLAHMLIDAGVEIVHGHSSHHPRPIEVYRGKVILYGCGDLINDYEGIGGYQSYRDDLRLVYLVRVAVDTGHLIAMRMAPMQARQMRLWQASGADTRWLRTQLDRVSRGFGAGIDLDPDGMLSVRPV